MSLAPSVASRIAPQPLAIGAILAVLGFAVVVLGTGQVPIVRTAVPPEGILILAVAAAGVGIVLARLEFGILLLPVVAIALPASVGTGTESSIPASLILGGLLCVLWVARTLVNGRLQLVGSPVVLPVVVLIVVVLLSTVNSNAVRPAIVQVWDTFDRVQLGGLSIFVVSAGLILVTMNAVRDLKWIRWLTGIFLATGTVAIAGYWIQGQRDLIGFNVGGLFSLWVVALALGQALFNDRLPGSVRVGLMVLAGAWMHRRLFFENPWLSGWVPISVAVLVLCFVHSKRAFVVAIAVTTVLAAALGPGIYERQVLGDDAAGNDLRQVLWQQNLDLAKDHLLLGVGPAGYAPYYMTFNRDLAMSSHSNYMDILSQTGVLGSLVFLWLFLAIGQVALGARRTWSSGFRSAFANGVLAGFAGMLVAMYLGDWLIPFVYNQTIAGFRSSIHSWIFLGALAGMHRMRE